MVVCFKIVVWGWSKVVGESRDVDKDIEFIIFGNLEVRSEGDGEDDF